MNAAQQREFLEGLAAFVDELKRERVHATSVVSDFRSQLDNDVLFSGTVQLDGTGVWRGDFGVPFGQVAVYDTAGLGPLYVRNSASEVTSTTEAGPGTIVVPQAGFICLPTAGRELSIWSPLNGPGAVGLVVATRRIDFGYAAQ